MTRPKPPGRLAEGVESRLAERAAGELARQLARPLPAGLYIVATPIGNLGDVTLRALAILATVDAIYCEDTRVTRTLLDHFAITGDLKRYDDHTAEAVGERILTALSAGGRIALVSDAGTPLVSDPGFRLVTAALAAGHAVQAVPGPSAALAALAIAGLPTDQFFFVGFLPARSGPRYARLKELAAIPATLIAFEAPSRLAATIADMAEVLGGDRPAAIARELTKLHEACARGTLQALAARFGPGPAEKIEERGEIAIVVGPAPPRSVDDDTIIKRLKEALDHQSLRDAAGAVAAALGVSRSRVYALGLRVKAKGGRSSASGP